MRAVENSELPNSSSSTSPRVQSGRPDWLLISTLAASAAYLYLRLFSFHNVPFLLGGDQDYYWMNGMRLLAGEHIYQDFFRYLPPGADLLYATLFKLLGARIWVTNLTVLALGIAFAWVCLSLSAKLMKRSLACLTTLVFIVFVYGKALNAFNYWFSILAIAAAVNLLMTGASRARLAACAALLALAAFFNQVNAAAALLAICLFLLLKYSSDKDNSRPVILDLSVLCFCFAIPLLLFNSYFIAQSGWQKLWDSQVTYVLTYPAHLSDSGTLGFAKSLTPVNLRGIIPYLPMYILLPIVYGMALWLCRSRRGTSFPCERVFLLSLVGLFLLAEVATAVNWLRLYSVSLPGVILFFCICAEWLSRQRYAAALIWLLTLAFGAQQVFAIHAVNSAEATLPGGVLATTPEYSEKLLWIAQRTHPGEFFFQAGWPGVYLPLQLRNPLYIATLSRFDIAYADDIDLTIQRLKSKPVHYILWTPLLDKDCSPELPCADSISPIRNYMQASYKCVHTFADGEIVWERDE